VLPPSQREGFHGCLDAVTPPNGFHSALALAQQSSVVPAFVQDGELARRIQDLRTATTYCQVIRIAHEAAAHLRLRYGHLFAPHMMLTAPPGLREKLEALDYVMAKVDFEERMTQQGAGPGGREWIPMVGAIDAAAAVASLRIVLLYPGFAGSQAGLPVSSPRPAR
jgi:hypothetical protein